MSLYIELTRIRRYLPLSHPPTHIHSPVPSPFSIHRLIITMGYLLFFQLVTAFLGALIYTNRLVNDLVTFESFGRISWNRPHLPPPIFSSTSVEVETLRFFFTAATTTATTTPILLPLEIVTSPTPSPSFNQTDSLPPPQLFLPPATPTSSIHWCRSGRGFSQL